VNLLKGPASDSLKARLRDSHTHSHTHTHTHLHLHTHTQKYTLTQTLTHTYAHKETLTHTHSLPHTNTHTHTHTLVQVERLLLWRVQIIRSLTDEVGGKLVRACLLSGLRSMLIWPVAVMGSVGGGGGG